MRNKRVVVGMSGGVDSSVAVWLLKEQGYEVIGVHMNFWQEKCAFHASEDAKRTADEIGIPYYVMNFKKEFKSCVIDYFVEEYIHGKTPNPCIVCNRYVKWEALLKRGRELGAEFIATGHYARIIKRENGRYTIAASKTAAKDQTYALYHLTQEQLSHTLMPVGEYTKEEIRSIAEKIGLKIADKPDSQEICFIPDHDYAGCPKTNEVVIGEAEDVFAKEFTADNIHYMGVENITDGMKFLTKIRYAHKGAMAAVYKQKDGKIRFVFEEEKRAITPGQSVVFYDGDCIAGGGVIL